MNNTEVNKRAREVEKELCEMRKQWVNMYDLITRLIEDTTTEYEEDLRIDYEKCSKCDNMDTDKNGMYCMINGTCHFIPTKNL